RPVTLRVTDAPPDEAVRMLRQSSPDLPIHFVKGAGAPAKLTMDLREVALGAALEWLEDSLPGYRAVVREYGTRITEQARGPPGAALLHDFWKGKREDKDKPPPAGAGAKNPPPEQVEGLIKGVDGEGLVKVSLGSDAGLTKGHTLEVFRLKPKPAYVGTVRILEVTATEAVGRSVGRMRTPPQEGDHVISTLRGSLRPPNPRAALQRGAAPRRAGSTCQRGYPFPRQGAAPPGRMRRPLPASRCGPGARLLDGT